MKRLCVWRVELNECNKKRNCVLNQLLSAVQYDTYLFLLHRIGDDMTSEKIVFTTSTIERKYVCDTFTGYRTSVHSAIDLCFIL